MLSNSHSARPPRLHVAGEEVWQAKGGVLFRFDPRDFTPRVKQVARLAHPISFTRETSSRGSRSGASGGVARPNSFTRGTRPRGSRLILLLLLLSLWPCPARAADTLFDLQTAKLVLDETGRARVEYASGPTAGPGGPAFSLTDDQGVHACTSAKSIEGQLQVEFENGAMAIFSAAEHKGFCLLELVSLTAPRTVEGLTAMSLPSPPAAERHSGTLNAAYFQGRALAVMGLEVNVHATMGHQQVQFGDRPGCSHTFERVEDAKSGRYAARFTATADAKPGGWSYRGTRLTRPLDLTGCKAIRAWVHGDGGGQSLKFQLYDNRGGYRDNYVPIDFKGWKQVTVTDSPINTIRYGRVECLNYYYNGLPPGKTVSCLIDRVEAILQRDGKEQAVLLEDFDSPASAVFAPSARPIEVRTYSRHGVQPLRLAVVACGEGQFMETIERMQRAAGLRVPRPGGAWNKTSPWTSKSYLFLTNLREAQVDQGVAMAKRGGFHLVLLGQESWCRSTGHYEVNADRYAGGLEGLKKAFGKFRDAGVRVGLHFLGASIYPPDKYLTPVPDPRLVKDAFVELAADVDEKATAIPVSADPTDFPMEDGGYMGKGSVLQIGDELIWYKTRSAGPPHGFAGCVRGYLGTTKAPHRKGDRVAHVLKSYGYFLFDMDTTLLAEVADRFARVANELKVEMIYFDGAERLQGDHWYYNPLLIKTFYDRLAFKDLQLQASSFGHYSWHLLSRSASADGHGDIKGYLDERSAWLDSFRANGMPLEIGWYYGYDVEATPDMFEYVMGTSIGYDCPISFQVSVDAARAHPFTGEILDLIRRYDELRLGGKVPPEMRRRLRIDKELGGKKEPAEREKLLHHRREFRLLDTPTGPVFQRVHYEPWNWHETAEVGGDKTGQFTVRILPPPGSGVPAGTFRVGVQIHARLVKPGAKPPAGAPAGTAPAAPKIVDPWIEIGGKRLTWKVTLEPGQYLTGWPGEPVRKNSPTPAGAPSLAAPETLAPAASTIPGAAAPPPADQIILPAGEHAVTFGHAGPAGTPMRIRLTLQGEEKFPVQAP